jgi:hypothetical protein
MEHIFWATLFSFSAFALAIEVSLRMIEAHRKETGRDRRRRR